MVEKNTQPQPPQPRKRKLSLKDKNFKAMILRRRGRNRGLIQLIRDKWAAELDAKSDVFAKKVADKKIQFSPLVKAVRTNGIEVKVIIVTLVPKQGFEIQNANAVALYRPAGIDELVEKGYNKILDTAHLGSDTRGLFKQVHAIATPADEVTVVRVGPGRVQIATAV